jgi:pimeloyl-ACP methyl ester carboxylesterase
MGGFLTVNYALEKPERLKKIVLLAPAATFVPFSEEWHFRVTLASVVATLAINEYDIRRSLSYALEGSCQMFGVTKEELAEDDEDVAELMLNFEEESLKELEERINSVLKRAKEYMYVPGNLDDEFIAQFVPADWLRIRTLKSPKLWRFDPRGLPEEDIKNLKTPTLLLIGDQEVVYEADQTLARAEELVENIQTALIPNCSHMLAYEQTELVNSHILDFLSGDK